MTTNLSGLLSWLVGGWGPLLPPADSSADNKIGTSSRPLQLVAQQFRGTLLGEDDVDIDKFMRACEVYAHLLERLGPFTMLMIREVHANLKKIEHTHQLSPREYASGRALLRAEQASGMHQVCLHAVHVRTSV